MRNSTDARRSILCRGWWPRPAARWAVAWLAATAIGLPASLVAAEPHHGSVVTVEGNSETGFRLLRNGEPFVIHGVGGTADLELLAACGGNAVRTWHLASVEPPVKGKSFLDRAQEHGLAVTVGIWLGHERHGFRYDDPEQVERQRAMVEAAVRKVKDHPAVLIWGLGNEMEGPSGTGDSALVWREVGHLAALIKRLDPNHPVMTVVANVNPAKLAAITAHAPAIDILGVNAYAGAAGIGAALRDHGWQKPYCVTEYGPPGPWEVPETDWQAPIEPSSRAKAAIYNASTKAILADTARGGPADRPPRCLGCFAFLWGAKQEATATWFGMLLPSGEKTLVVDAMTDAWTGRWPANRAPVLRQHDVPLAGRRLEPGQTVAVEVTYKDPEGDQLTYEWEVVKESTDRREGGDAEARPDSVPGCISEADGEGRATVTLPATPGGYRLFVTVRDGHGSGCSDNWPFFVNP
jgi:hypothetical protein